MIIIIKQMNKKKDISFHLYPLFYLFRYYLNYSAENPAVVAAATNPSYALAALKSTAGYDV